VEKERGRGGDLGLESEMSDLMMFWKCFAVRREREKKKVIDDRERREASGCGETWGNKRRRSSKY